MLLCLQSVSNAFHSATPSGHPSQLSLEPRTGKPVLLAGTAYRTRARRPWVYVYELPPELTTWCDRLSPSSNPARPRKSDPPK